MKYDIIPNLKDMDFQFKLNIDLLNISEKLVEKMFEKMIYPNFVSTKIPDTDKHSD